MSLPFPLRSFVWRGCVVAIACGAVCVDAAASEERFAASDLAGWVVLGQDAPPNPMMMMGLMAVMFVGAYFLMIRPQQLERKAHETRLKDLKKNDTVITSGGIVGTVVAVNPGSKTITLRIDEGTNAKMKVLKSAIVQVGDAMTKDDPEPAK